MSSFPLHSGTHHSTSLQDGSMTASSHDGSGNGPSGLVPENLASETFNMQSSAASDVKTNDEARSDDTDAKSSVNSNADTNTNAEVSANRSPLIGNRANDQDLPACFSGYKAGLHTPERVDGVSPPSVSILLEVTYTYQVDGETASYRYVFMHKTIGGVKKEVANWGDGPSVSERAALLARFAADADLLAGVV